MDSYDYCVYSDVGYDENATLQGEMSVILIIAVVIIIVVLTPDLAPTPRSLC